MNMLNNSPLGLGLDQVWTVYSVTCTANGKMFIGITTDYKRIKREIKGGLERLDTERVNLFMLADCILYGVEAFEFENLGEVESKEEARITAWFLTLEEKEVERESMDGAPEWVVSENVYNRQGISLGKLSDAGKEMVTAMTDMAVMDSGRIAVDIQTNRSAIYHGRRKRLADKTIWKRYRRKRK